VTILRKKGISVQAPCPVDDSRCATKCNNLPTTGVSNAGIQQCDSKVALSLPANDPTLSSLGKFERTGETQQNAPISAEQWNSFPPQSTPLEKRHWYYRRRGIPRILVHNRVHCSQCHRLGGWSPIARFRKQAYEPENCYTSKTICESTEKKQKWLAHLRKTKDSHRLAHWAKLPSTK